MEVIKITKNELDYIPAVCLDPSVGKKGKEKMKGAMDKRIEWIKDMMVKGLEIFVALEPPKDEIITYKWVGKLNHLDLAINGKAPMGLLECMPIEYILEQITRNNSLFINCMWILPPFWKKGVGHALITKFIERAREIGSASIIVYDKISWFDTSIEYMPLEFFKKYGFKEVDRDEDRILLFLDFKTKISPKFIRPHFSAELNSEKDKLSLFCNHQCPWSTYMVKEIIEGIKSNKDIEYKIISTNERTVIENYGIARGVRLGNKSLFKRMITWDQVKKKINALKLTN